MATENVPKHHGQQELCTTRAPYRQGRELKAVKVYTVNQESKYLLIQGVPSLGASKDLIKLCALYGAVSEYRILDDYPVTEPFTEVYWVKFSRIQSSRYAKRKLDNHAFFGGTLHVCYAPEYESVEETREKLQERRRIIASKTRQHSETMVESGMPPESSEVTNVREDLQSNHEITRSNGNETKEITAMEMTDNSFRWTDKHINQIQNEGVLRTATDNYDLSQKPNDQNPYFTIQIPPPPQVMYSNSMPSQYYPQKFDHARVPSSHATLPHGYDPRAHNSTFKQKPHLSYPSSQFINNTSAGDKSDSAGKIELKNKQAPQEKKAAMPHVGGVASVPGDLGKHKNKTDSGKVVLKQFQKLGTVPKFIPRQADQALKKRTIPMEQTSDAVGKQIRINAVKLRENVQGPTLPDGKLHTGEPETPQAVSVQKSISHIRNKVKQFSDGIPQKKFKPG